MVIDAKAKCPDRLCKLGCKRRSRQKNEAKIIDPDNEHIGFYNQAL